MFGRARVADLIDLFFLLSPPLPDRTSFTHPPPDTRGIPDLKHAKTMFEVSNSQFQLVYNVLSFSLASMAASTIFFWTRISGVHEKYKAALSITALVTFIAMYHYFRIFNSWVEAYEYPPWSGNVSDPQLTGKPFNDAYRLALARGAFALRISLFFSFLLLPHFLSALY